MSMISEMPINKGWKWCPPQGNESSVRFRPSPPAFARKTSYGSASQPGTETRPALNGQGSEGCRAIARSATAGQNSMQGFHYTYILQSDTEPGSYYVGLTDHLQDRLARH